VIVEIFAVGRIGIAHDARGTLGRAVPIA
jgi:hypothetical protein